MKKKSIYISVLALIFATVLFSVRERSEFQIFQQNIDALASNEEINVITCIPEEGAICITYEVSYVMVNHYFSPH